MINVLNYCILHTPMTHFYSATLCCSFCTNTDSCKKLHSIKDDDGLDSLVSALPPSYTSRFGEIVWAAGGNGFGWWPACIYE